MTRITNFGRKRTYVEAGFNTGETTDRVHRPESLGSFGIPSDPTESPNRIIIGHGPSKKKRKGDAKSRPISFTTGETTVDSDGNDRGEPSSSQGNVPKTESQKNKKRHKEKQTVLVRDAGVSDHAKRVEARRNKRVAQRQADTVCFACRQKGHSAADCSIVRSNLDGENTKNSAPKTVGICYRCGSKRHTLARCKKPVDPTNALPFARCFVCSSIGHLASLCPQNKSKGIYPNGGCCKLCGDNTHLARNCKLRKDESNNQEIPFGIAGDDQRGADEDDFHLFKRRKIEIEKEEKKEDKRKRLSDIKIGAHSGVVKAFGNPHVTSKKVVNF